MSGFTSLDRMFADLALSTMSTVPVELSEQKKAEIMAAYEDLMRQEKAIPRSREDKYYAPAYAAELHGVKIPESGEEMKRPATVITDGKKYECRVAHYPFSRGGVRAAYFGKLKEAGSGSSVWKDVVLKEFIYPNDRTLVEYRNQSENSAVAKYLM